MSIHAMAPVWKANLKPNHKFVLLAYADSANEDGTESWPSWDALVEMTGYSRSTIAGVTKELIDLGVLVQTKRGRKGQRAEYTVVLDHPLITGSDNGTLFSGSNPTDDRVQEPDDRVQNTAHRVQPTGPLPSSSSVLSSRPVTPAPDYQTRMKDAIVAAMGWNPSDVTASQWGRVEKAGKELRDISADPDDVARRAAIYVVNMPTGATLTPTALAGNWADCDQPRVPLSKQDVARAAERQRTIDLMNTPTPISEARRKAQARR